MSAAEQLDEVERTPEAQYNDVLRALRQSEHRTFMLAKIVLELASEMLGEEVEYEKEGPLSTKAILLAHDCLNYWRS
jgi:hypothetical protein